MKITKSRLRQLIKEELMESAQDIDPRTHELDMPGYDDPDLRWKEGGSPRPGDEAQLQSLLDELRKILIRWPDADKPMEVFVRMLRQFTDLDIHLGDPQSPSTLRPPPPEEEPPRHATDPEHPGAFGALPPKPKFRISRVPPKK